MIGPEIQSLAQFAGYVIVVVGAHWVTRGDLKTTLTSLKQSVDQLTDQLRLMKNDVSAHERRITSLEGRVDMIGMINRSMPDKMDVNLSTTPEPMHTGADSSV